MSARIWADLVANGYLNASGDIQNKFDPKNPHFSLTIADEFCDLKPEIIDEINRKLFKNRIANARDRRELKFRKEVQLSDEFMALWDKIKHRTRYRVFDAIEYESEVERQFARDLDNNENVRLFVKLPSWFKIDTPIGPYNPDWAFVTDRDEKLYFVRETKSTLDSEERRSKENQKIDCGRRHFESIGVDYAVVTSLAEVNF